jgi:hypothetical protein
MIVLSEIPNTRNAKLRRQYLAEADAWMSAITESEDGPSSTESTTITTNNDLINTPTKSPDISQNVLWKE